MNFKALGYTLLVVIAVIAGLTLISGVSTNEKDQIPSQKSKIDNSTKLEEKIKYFTTNQVDDFPFYNTLNAKVGGKSFKIMNQEEGEALCIRIFETKDFDEDGFLDALIELVEGCGGNCCLSSYLFCSFNGKEFQLSEGFGYGGAKIEKWKGIWTVKTGTTVWGSSEMFDTDERYKLQKGEAVQVEYEEKKPIKAILEFRSKDFIDEFEEERIEFDLNSDGVKDTIVCEYWSRWESMNWEIKFSNGMSSDNTETGGCKRIGILASKTRGVHDIVCDFDEVLVWSGKKYKVKK